MWAVRALWLCGFHTFDHLVNEIRTHLNPKLYKKNLIFVRMFGDCQNTKRGILDI